MNTDFVIDVLAGTTGGIASVFVGQPLDTIKVKMQVLPNIHKTMYSCVVKTVQQQGFRSLYAGTIPSIVSNAADNAVTFGTFGRCQQMVASMVGVGGDTTDLTCLQNAASGSMTSIFTSFILCPAELVKIRLQSSTNNTQKKGQPIPSINQVFQKIWKTDGFKGLFRGMGFTISRESIGCSVLFGSYEWTREMLKPNGKKKEDCGALTTAISGAIAGVLMWSVIYPIDTIKTRVQMSEKPIGLRMIREEIRNTGLRGLYSGLLPTLMKTIPVTGVLLFSVEFSKPIFRTCLSEMTTVSSVLTDHKFFSLCDFLSGWTAGIVSTFVGHPMDTIRVVQQVTNSSATKAAQEINNQDKFTGYFRGMMFPILSTGVVNSVFFGVYGNMMRLIQIYRNDELRSNTNIRFCCDAENLNNHWHMDVFMSACVGGFFFTLINIPNEVVKTMLQASNISTSKPDNYGSPKKVEPPKITRPMELITELYKTHGIRSLFRGGTLLMFRDVPSMGIYMLTYEHVCSILKKSLYTETQLDTKHQSMPLFIQVIAGGVAGVTCWIPVLPFDVIKSKVIVDSLSAQPRYKGAWDCAKKIYIEGGASRFFRGFWLLCIRAFPVNGITFLVYEILLKTCSNTEINEFPSTTLKSRWL